MKKLLGWFTAALFLIAMLTLTIPHLLLNVAWSGLRGENEIEYRKRLSLWALRWGERFFSLVQATLRLRVKYDIDNAIRNGSSCVGKIPRPNPIIIANHRTAIDHPIVAITAMKYGVTDIRWVLKSQMHRAPVVGWLMSQLQCAFVTRSRDKSDMHRIQDMVDVARMDDASVMIYPEGTRFDGTPKPDSQFSHVRDPKFRGFQEVCGNLQSRDVLVIVIDWGDMQGGKTMWDGDAFFGRTVRVHAYPVNNPGFKGAKQALEQAWHRADELIDAQGQVSVCPEPKSQAIKSS